jgi:hypothetical protein
MSKHDSPALVDPALFWGWVLGILFIFIKAAKGKRNKGVFAMGHNVLSYGRDLFSFFLCGFYEKRCRQYGITVTRKYLPIILTLLSDAINAYLL